MNKQNKHIKTKKEITKRILFLLILIFSILLQTKTINATIFVILEAYDCKGDQNCVNPGMGWAVGSCSQTGTGVFSCSSTTDVYLQGFNFYTLRAVTAGGIITSIQTNNKQNSQLSYQQACSSADCKMIVQSGVVIDTSTTIRPRPVLPTGQYSVLATVQESQTSQPTPAPQPTTTTQPTTTSPPASKCTNDCSTAGQKECVSGGYTQARTCQKDANGCLKWATQTCNYGQICSSGSCIDCGNDCDVGDTNCVSNQVQYCSEIAPGCKKFSSLASCPSGTTCQEAKGCVDSNGLIVQIQAPPPIIPQSTLPQTVLPITFDKTPSQLIKNVNKCGKTLPNAVANAIKPHAVCQPWGAWMLSDNSQDTLEKTNPFGTEPTKIPVKWKCNPNFHLTGCCAQTSCWDGEGCKNNGDVFDADKKGYYCDNGDWALKPKKINYDKTEEGFCPTEDKCLVTNAAPVTATTDPLQFFKATTRAAQPRCVENKAYLKDEYCDNGNWTSRTKLAAVQLLAYAEATSPTDYDIFCDDYTNTLNRVKYATGKGFVEKFIKEGDCIKEGTNKKVPCVNNFCVLKTPTGVKAIATSLNTKVNSQTSFLNTLGVDNSVCDVAMTGTGFTKCLPQSTLQGQVWYNGQTESIIYLPPQLSSNVQDSYTEPELKKILNFIETKNSTDPVQDFRFFKDTTAMNKIMYSKKGLRNIFAVLEKQPSKDPASKAQYLGVKYSGFSIGTDPCLFFKNYFDKKTICEKQLGQYDFVLTSKDISDITKALRWKDLSAKLRLLQGQQVQMTTDLATSTPQTQGQITEEIEPDCPQSTTQ